MVEAILKVKYSLVAFTSGVLPPIVWLLLLQGGDDSAAIIFLRLTLSCLISLIFGRALFPDFFDVWWRAALIGSGFSLGLYLITSFDNLRPFGAYACILFSFHYLEYAVTGLTNPSNLKTDSFLLNHSPQYWIAAIASWAEHLVELYFFPSLKLATYIYGLGIAVCLAGEILRKTAMFHAGRSFSHIVQSTKKEDHILVTHGVFAYMRRRYLCSFHFSVA